MSKKFQFPIVLIDWTCLEKEIKKWLAVKEKQYVPTEMFVILHCLIRDDTIFKNNILINESIYNINKLQTYFFSCYSVIPPHNVKDHSIT